MTRTEALALVLTELSWQHGIAAEELAAALGVDVATVWRMWSGELDICEPHLAAWCLLLEEPPELVVDAVALLLHPVSDRAAAVVPRVWRGRWAMPDVVPRSRCQLTR